MVKSYKELIGYQKAYQLVLAIYELTVAFPPTEIYGLTSQMRRCAVSIPSNIAEGHMRGTKEYVQFLKIALGSAAELETQPTRPGANLPASVGRPTRAADRFVCKQARREDILPGSRFGS